MRKKPITAQQKRFLTEYASSLDAEKAAKLAGYKTSNIRHLTKTILLEDNYREEFEKIISERASYLDVSRGYIVKKYLELVEYATKQENNTPKDPVLGLRALDGLCKHLPKGDIEDEESVLSARIEGLEVERI